MISWKNLTSWKGFELGLVLGVPNDPKSLLIHLLHLVMNLNIHKQLGTIHTYDSDFILKNSFGVLQLTLVKV